MISDVRITHARKSRSGNTKMARFTFSDLEQSIECLIFPDDYLRCQEYIVEEAVVFIRATLDRTRESPVLIVTKVLTYEQLARESIRAVLLRLSLSQHSPYLIEEIQNILQRSPGRCPVYIEIRDPLNRRALFALDKSLSVDVPTLDCEALEQLLGTDGVYFQRTNGLTQAGLVR
jgi:DNA polymerase-3 subunit alpha